MMAGLESGLYYFTEEHDTCFSSLCKKQTSEETHRKPTNTIIVKFFVEKYGL